MSSSEKVVQQEFLESDDFKNSSSIEEQKSRFERLIYGLNQVTHKIAMLILFFMMILTTTDVIGRYFFYKPITGAYELTGLAMVVMIFFSLGMTELKKEHISIDFLTSKLSTKWKESISLFTSTVMVVLLGITSWQLFAYADRFGAQTSGDLGIPMKFFAILAGIGVLFFALTIVLNCWQSIKKVVQKGES